MSDKPTFKTRSGIEIPAISIEELPKVLGIEPGDQIEFVTPQFHRNPSEPTPGVPTDWGELRTLDRDELRNRGCKGWCDPQEDDWPLKGQELLLFPGEWYNHIPPGFEVVDINGETEPFVPGHTDDDIRFGCLAFGILAAGKATT